MVYDDFLRIEAYRFEGIVQPFPSHFHEYYVIGYVEKGTCTLSCNGQCYTVRPGDMLLFHPGDNHACTQLSTEALDYRSLSIPIPVMLDWMEKRAGTRQLPSFSQTVIQNNRASRCLRHLHTQIMTGAGDFSREAQFLRLLSMLIAEYGQPAPLIFPHCPNKIESACRFMEQHYAARLTLDQIRRTVWLSKSALLRAFSKAKGITPYGYLENVRINRAKQLLAQGVSPLDTALQTGFSDQSHLTNYFSRFIGLPPGAYRAVFHPKPKDGAT